MKCYFCNKSTDTSGMVVSNGEENAFSFLPLNESAHLECYIEGGVKQSIKKELNK